MPNHYTNVLTIVPDGEGPFGAELVSRLLNEWVADPPPPPATAESAVDKLIREYCTRPLHRVQPVSYPEPDDGNENIIAAQVEAHGVKWDVYEHHCFELPGDGGAVLLMFCTAWGPPKSATRWLVMRELHERWGVEKVRWDGFDPASDGFDRFGVVDFTERRGM